MESMSEFEARLKRTQSRARVRTQRGYAPENDAHDKAPRSSASSRSRSVTVVLVGCVLVASAFAFAREDIARVLSSADDVQRISSLGS